MAITDVTICNSALTKVGAQRISALSDNNDRARLCTEQYDKNRQNLLVSHPWKFARDRVALSASITAPAYGWAYKFPLPSDCLRVWGTSTEPDDWTTEGRFLFSNSSEISINYIKDLTDESLFTPSFAEALACMIAEDISYALTKSSSLLENLQKKTKAAIAFARNQNGQEGVGDRIYADTWLNARY